jgi:hypothetical protein
MAHLVDPEKKMAAVLFGMASAMPWMLQSFDDDSRYATLVWGSRPLASCDWEDTTCPPHTVASPEPRWATLPRPSKEGLCGGGNGRGGELCAIVGDGGRSSWRLG